MRHSKIRLLQALPALLYSVLALKFRLIVPKMTLKSKIIIFLLDYKPLISLRILQLTTWSNSRASTDWLTLPLAYKSSALAYINWVISHSAQLAWTGWGRLVLKRGEQRLEERKLGLGGISAVQYQYINKTALTPLLTSPLSSLSTCLLPTTPLLLLWSHPVPFHPIPNDSKGIGNKAADPSTPIQSQTCIQFQFQAPVHATQPISNSNTGSGKFPVMQASSECGRMLYAKSQKMQGNEC